MITDYLGELLGELRVAGRRRRRIRAEVEDHLTCAAAELHAGGLDAEAAEREAVRRFGPAPEIARAFLDHEAARGGKEVARASAVLAAVVAVFVVGPAGRALPYAGFATGLVAFVVAQVALVAGGLTFVRVLRTGPDGGPSGPHLRLVLRGALVVVCSSAVAMSSVAVRVIPRASGNGAAAWLTLAALGIGVAATAATLRRSWRRARAAPTLGATSAPAASLLEECQAVLAHRAPRVGAWLDLPRHPWRFAIVVSMVVAVALSAGHAVSEGVSANHLRGELIAFALIATVEAVAALLGFAVLGRFLGIRPARAGASGLDR